jgi:hypothetical protein
VTLGLCLLVLCGLIVYEVTRFAERRQHVRRHIVHGHAHD